MDNIINELLHNIKYLRSVMLEAQQAMQADIAHDRDCALVADTLLGQRLEMAGLANKRKALGDLTSIGPIS
jgi:hypothetical protein